MGAFSDAGALTIAIITCILMINGLHKHLFLVYRTHISAIFYVQIEVREISMQILLKIEVYIYIIDACNENVIIFNT